MTTRNHCPLCQSTTIGYFTTLDTRQISKCTSCSLVFTSRFDEEILSRAYKEDYYSSPDDPRIDVLIESDGFIWDDLVSDLSRLNIPITTLLDIGAGSGGFLLKYSLKNPQTKLYAVESSSEAKENLQKRIPKLHLLDGAAEDLIKLDSALDAITCLQCLEHVLDPLGVCKQANRLLARNGAFLITVPNRFSFQELRRDRAKSLCYGNRTHLQFFSLSTLERLLQQAGFVNITRVVKFGGGHYRGVMASLQYALRSLGISTELRFIARKL